jgi:glutathione S-transferase
MKVVWLLEELGLPYERIDVGGPFGGTRTPEYMAMNPNCSVPTLQEGGFTLWESNVIIRYLCAAHAPGHAMWPDDLQARANIDRWMDWQQTTLGPPMTVVFQGLVRTPPERRDMAAIEAATVRVGEQWGLLDRVLAGHDHVAGAAFTLADIPLGVHVHRWFNLAVPRPDLPHLAAWYQRLLGRPAYRAHCAAPVT